MPRPKIENPTARDEAVASLVALLTSTTERVPARVWRHHAQQSGYSVRHLQRLVRQRLLAAAADAVHPPAAVDLVEIKSAVFLYCGNLSGAYRFLQRQISSGQLEGRLGSRRSFYRLVRNHMSPVEMAYATEGSAGVRDAQVHLPIDYQHRGSTYLLDHTELPIFVVPRGHKQAVKPWLTAVMDGHTRYLLSWVVTFGRPTSEEVRAALVQAMLLRTAPDGETEVGGRPMRAVWDRGLEFLADLISESCLRLGVMPVALPAYSPHLKGRLERFWRFLQTDLLAPLPGYAGRPKDLRGQQAIAAYALHEDEFLVQLASWMNEYNTGHQHSREGVTPLQAWRSDVTPLDEVPEEQLLVDFLQAKDAVKISKNGIRFDTVDYVAPEIADRVGRSVQIRHLPHDRSFIEVFLEGKHLCTAYPAAELTPDQQEAFLSRRAESRREAKRQFTVANRMRRNGRTTSKLNVDKHGRRHVAEADLLTGGDEALREILGMGQPTRSADR